MSRHTPEPWYRFSTRVPGWVGIGADVDGKTRMILSGNHNLDNAKADEDRAIACVNACTGLVPEHIPALVEVAQNAVDAGAIDEIHLSLVRDSLAAVKGTQQ